VVVAACIFFLAVHVDYRHTFMLRNNKYIAVKPLHTFNGKIAIWVPFGPLTLDLKWHQCFAERWAVPLTTLAALSYLV